MSSRSATRRIGAAAVIALSVFGAATLASAASFGTAVSVNPQPLPPRPGFEAARIGADSFGGPVSINPQPLPPRPTFGDGR